MPAPPDAGGRPRRILVVANETCAGRGVVDEVAYRAGGGAADVVVVAPALARSRLEHWLSSDLGRRRQEAGERLEASLTALSEAGLRAQGHLGDADPLQALDDALRMHEPDEVVIATHPHGRSNWLERQVVRRAREAYPVPITHIVVDLEHEVASADPGRPPPAPARPRSTRVFHASRYDDALAIRDRGFRDGPAGGGAGVLVTDRPPAAGDAEDAVVLAVDLPAGAIEGYAREPAPEGGRSYVVPAALLNRHGPPVLDGQWSE